MNRETWLTQAAQELETALFQPLGKSLPPKWRVSCSWPSSRASAKNASGTIGQCFDPAASADNTAEMLVSMSQDDPMEVLSILAHEMVHAIEGIAAGHGAVFKRTALAIGLTGKMTATKAGEVFKQSVTPIMINLGDYPHAAVDLTKRKKQTTRMVKMACGECGYIARTSRANIEKHGATICPCNHEPMAQS
mgnify:CR=1 FL=1|tara:strand:+ start:1226 stop:1801 length:576 start_codon:yes stop_codon:yes gene_type:complete